ncbi:GTP-binding protein Rhes [Synchiropus picturatus]
MFDILTSHHQPTLPAVAKSKLLQFYNSSRSGMGMLRKVKEQSRQRGKGDAEARSSSGSRLVSTDRVPKRSMDLLELQGVIKPRNRQRIVVLGGPRVGKSSIIRRFLGEEFVETYEPTSEEFHRKLFHVGGEAYQVDLLDAAGERNFPAKRRLSILTGDIFLLVFSLDDRESLIEACDLLAEIKEAKAKLLKKSPVVPVVICGNKVDQRREVSRSEVTALLGDESAYYIETSAKDGSGLDGAFMELAVVGGLPVETSPTLHQAVSLLTYHSLCVNTRGRRRWSRTRGLGAPCAAVDPLARRPSFTSDLKMVLGSSAKHSKPEGCQIQ